MILWKDFVMDDFFGPYLKIDENCKAVAGGLGVMDDAIVIQETGQETKPARMVGHSGLDLPESGMEASRGPRQLLRWSGGRT